MPRRQDPRYNGAAYLLVWLLSLVFVTALTAVNVAGVRNFGEFEFWFAILKVLAVGAFILIGAALIFGWLPAVASPGLSNLFGSGGFAPPGVGGIASALLVVVFAFGGTEIVSVAAAETGQHPASDYTLNCEEPVKRPGRLLVARVEIEVGAADA